MESAPAAAADLATSYGSKYGLAKVLLILQNDVLTLESI
jgi:hypothetical protein